MKIEEVIRLTEEIREIQHNIKSVSDPAFFTCRSSYVKEFQEAWDIQSPFLRNHTLELLQKHLDEKLAELRAINPVSIEL